MIKFDKNEFLESQIYSTLDEYESRCNVTKEIIEEVKQLQQENKQLKENYERLYNENCKLRERHNINDISLLDENYRLENNWNKLKEYINKMHEYFLYTDINEIYEQSMKLDNQFPSLFNLSELNASDRILSSICKKVQELEQGSDSNE